MRHLLKMTLLSAVLLAPDGGVGGPVPGPGGGAPSQPSAPSAPAAPASAPAPAAPSQPSGAAPSPEPAARPNVSTQIGDIPDDIMALFNGDPSPVPASVPVQPQPGQTPTAVQPQPGQSPGAVPPLTPTATPPGPVAPQPGSDPALAAAIATLAETVSRMPAGGQPQPQGQPQPDQGELPQHGYVYNIPDGLDTALVSDDPATRKTALASLVQGTSQTIHREVVKAMRAEFGRVVPSIVQNMITQHRTQQNVAQDFYGTYKEFANPVFRPLVQQVALQIVREKGASGWTPDLRDAIGARMREVLQSAGFAAGAQPVQPQLPQAPVGPAAIMPGGSRPAVVADPTNQFRELL